jgi:hypothetical protein
MRPRAEQAATAVNGIAERAKVISVLRKAEELIDEGNLPKGQETPRRALELAAGRVGLTIEEYEALVKGDAELIDLERKVLESAREARLRSLPSSHSQGVRIVTSPMRLFVA